MKGLFSSVGVNNKQRSKKLKIERLIFIVI